jgi:hypothetical protein
MTRPATTASLALFLVACSGGGSAARDDGGADITSAQDAHTDAEGAHVRAEAGRQPDGARRDDASRGADGASRDAGVDHGHDGGVSAGPTFGGCPLFAPGYAYNQDVSQSPVDPSSATYISNLTSLAPDIAAELPGGEYYNLVPSSQTAVPVQTASAYGFEPDGGFFYDTDASLAAVTAPIPPGVVYENMTTPNADHHMIVLEQGACMLYELYAENPSNATTGWDVLVQWDLRGSPQIPPSLDTGSTTQAGTPLLPGIIWPVDVAAGEIDHAIDIVMADNAIMPCAYVHPASTVRYSGAPAGQGIPYGARFRLKASFDVSTFTGTQALVVIRALQTYGMIPTDASGESRSVFRLGQSPDGGTLDEADMNQLNVLTWSDFDVMPLGTVVHPAGCTP